MKILFLSKIIEPNGYMTTSSLSEINIFIHINLAPNKETMQKNSLIMLHQNPMESDLKYNPLASLKLSKGYKQNNIVIFNPKNNKENTKIHIHIPCMCRFIIHICTHIY